MAATPGGMNLPTLQEWEWVQLDPPNPYQRRLADPATFFSDGDVKLMVGQVQQATVEPFVAQAADLYFPDLFRVLTTWMEAGSLNQAPRGDLVAYAVQGAAVAAAESRSTPARVGFTHPRWHVILTLFEAGAALDVGQAGIVALNAAHRGQRMGMSWSRALAQLK